MGKEIGYMRIVREIKRGIDMRQGGAINDIEIKKNNEGKRQRKKKRVSGQNIVMAMK